MRPLTTALGLLMVLAGALSAQTPDALTLRLGFGGNKMDFTCSECGIDAENGITAFVAVSAPIGGRFTAGVETTFSDAGFESNGQEHKHARLLAPMATAGLRASSQLPIWGTLGLGWMWYSGIGPGFNGAALSLRAGTDLKLGGLWFVSPYAGYMTMVGHDGPELGVTTDPSQPFHVVQSRPSSFQLGVALSRRL